MSRKVLVPLGASVGGASIYGGHAYYTTENLKKLPNETDDDFNRRRRKLILANALSGGVAGGALGHGYVNHKGQMLGSALGITSGELMSSDEVNFDRMSAEMQDEHMRLKPAARLLGAVGGGITGRVAGMSKMPGLHREKNASFRNRLEDII